jgi:hypothetical protein
MRCKQPEYGGHWTVVSKNSGNGAGVAPEGGAPVSNTHMEETCLHVGAGVDAWLRTARWSAGAFTALALGLASPGTAQLRELPQQDSAPSELTLRTGDFITATASAEEAMTLRIIQPDGSVLRTWMVGTTPSRVAFVAATAGVHRWEFVPTGGAPRVATGRAPAGQLTLHGVTSLDTRLQPRVFDQSPMMLELRRRVAAGDWKPEPFWTDVANMGTPIVEEGDDTRYQIVTFLWRAVGETRNVSVIGTFMKAPLAEPLQHVADTDVWYRTFRIPAGARFSYLLSPNSPSTARTPCSSLRPCRPTRSTPIGGCAPLMPKFTSVSPEPNFLAQRRSRGLPSGQRYQGAR